MMGKIRIIKKNDEYSPEYEVGDIIEITGTWYGGVHITGKSGVPVSLDKEEYVMLDTEPEEKKGNNVTGIMAVVLIITLAGMGGFVYKK